MKNYTSKVPAATSIAKTKKLLLRAGASSITEKYASTGEIVAISFVILLNLKPVKFDLPAKVLFLYSKLINEYKKPTDKSYKDALAQAHRTAWKTIAEWVEIQLEMIEAEQADKIQLFLPYMTDGQESYYDKWKNNQKLLS